MPQTDGRRWYRQWTRKFHDSSSGLPSNCVNVLSRVGDAIWAGTERGISIKQEGGWKHASSDGWPQGSVDLIIQYGNRVFAASDGALLCYDGTSWSVSEGPEAGLKADIDSSGALWVCAPDGLWRFDGSSWTHARRTEARGMEYRDFRCLGEEGSRAVAATSRGLFFLQGKRPYWFVVRAREEGMLSNDTRCAVPDEAGHIWVGTDRGISIYAGGDGWCSLRGEDGLPQEDVRLTKVTPWGDHWFGTNSGVILLKEGRWKYFASRRWLPSDQVTDILPLGDGEAFVATRGGISHLKSVQMTLEEKASQYEATVRKYHTRIGFVTGRVLSAPGEISSGQVRISDNDGLWTSLYIAAEAFRYSVTQDAEAKAFARESLDALMRLEQVTGIPGFPARAIRGRGEAGFGDGHPEWHPTPDGEWEWKGDTSSDEIDGHYFAMTIYYDLVAGKRERQLLEEYAKRLTDHIITHDYFLVDLDGEPTTWGVWSPKRLNHDDRWRMQRGLNSLEILSYLRSANHLTGDETYLDRYRQLATKHHYAINTIKQRQTVLGHQVWHDDRLAYLAYYPLLRYEDDPALRQIYLLSLERTWHQIRGQRNSLWNIITSAVMGTPHDIEAAADTLGDYPLDLISWTVRNSHRSDVTLDAQRPNSATEPLPADERPVGEWAGNLHILDGGSEGRSALEGTCFLLPYWMGRYHGFLD